jgi:succinate dehydrogenase / fumarate reductase flavoprotein subunit
MVAPFARNEGESPYDVQRALQQCMERYVGIFRTQQDLEQALSEIGRIKERARRVRVEVAACTTRAGTSRAISSA